MFTINYYRNTIPDNLFKNVITTLPLSDPPIFKLLPFPSHTYEDHLQKILNAFDIKNSQSSHTNFLLENMEDLFLFGNLLITEDRQKLFRDYYSKNKCHSEFKIKFLLIEITLDENNVVDENNNVIVFNDTLVKFIHLFAEKINSIIDFQNKNYFHCIYEKDEDCIMEICDKLELSASFIRHKNKNLFLFQRIKQYTNSEKKLIHVNLKN